MVYITWIYKKKNTTGDTGVDIIGLEKISTKKKQESHLNFVTSLVGFFFVFFCIFLFFFCIFLSFFLYFSMKIFNIIQNIGYLQEFTKKYKT